MGLRINQNVAAMNSYRNLSVTEGQLSKSLEKLSSGFRINRAADDAAGLAISEKLRGQVNGLNQASANAQNGISLIQTAEGALNESHSIMQRMRELAVQSANDTNTDADRAQIQKEVDQLSQELSRIGASTQFNTKNLLDGTFKNATFQIGANQGQTLSVSVADSRGYALGLAGKTEGDVTGVVVTTATSDKIADGTYTVDSTGTKLLDKDGNAVTGVTVASATGVVTVNTTAATDSTYTFGSLSAGDKVTLSSTGTVAKAEVAVTNNGLQAGEYTVSGTDVLDSAGSKVGTWSTTAKTVTGLNGTVLADFADTANVGTTLRVGGVDVSSSAAATKAITTVQTGIDKVSDQRSTLGAVQNRLEHTIANLGVASENLAASESRIRDTDMAAEMMKFTRAQILSQAGTAMLAQANQIPQSVLSLLR